MADAPQKIFSDFVETVAHLRQECPWDKKQTHASLRKHLLEEAYETLEAIDQVTQAENDGTAQELTAASRNLCDELGDLLYQVFFHSLLASEREDFDISDVLSAINEKLIRRHPHVFGDLEVSSEEELAPHWEAIKQSETARESVMDGIPEALPALLFASKLQRKAISQGAQPAGGSGLAGSGLAGSGLGGAGLGGAGAATADLGVGAGAAAADLDEQTHLDEQTVGELLFGIVHLATQQGVDCEAALRQAAKNFRSRFQELESQTADVSQPEAVAYIWNDAQHNKPAG